MPALALAQPLSRGAKAALCCVLLCLPLVTGAAWQLHAAPSEQGSGLGAPPPPLALEPTFRLTTPTADGRRTPAPLLLAIVLIPLGYGLLPAPAWAFLRPSVRLPQRRRLLLLGQLRLEGG